MRLQTPLLRWALPLSIILGTVFQASDAFAAERVVLRYRFLRRSVSVEELSTLAQTGEVSPALRIYLGLARQEPESLRRTLNQDVQIDVVTLDRILNNPAGNLVLDQVSQAIYTPSRQADRQALRSALVLSASDDNRISVIEVLENYPTEEVHVDVERVLSAFNQLRNLQNRLQNILGRIGNIIY